MIEQAQKERIFICGGAGYVGGYLTDLLAQSGYEVTVFDNLTYEPRFLKSVHFIYGDVRDHEKLAQYIPDYDVVIWLAAIVGDGACGLNPALSTAVNVHSVEWLTKHYVGKIVFMSTCSVYGLNNELSDETSPTNPLSHYAATKLEAEREIIANAKNYLAFRLGTLFGVSDQNSRVRFDLVANALTMKAALGETLTVFGGGQWRPLLHVKDAAEAVLFGLKNNLQGLYNLSMDNYMICDIAREIERIIPETRIEFVNKKFEDLRNYKVTSAKWLAHGWRPKHTLADGVREVYQILNDGRIKRPKDLVYSNFEYLKEKLI